MKQLTNNERLETTADKLADLITGPPEGGQPFIQGTFEGGWVVECMMREPGTGRKVRAILLSVVTDGEDVFHLFPEEFVDGLGTVIGNIDPDLGHHLDRLGPDTGRVRPRTKDRKAVAKSGPDQTLCHLGTSRVSRTKD